MSEELSAERVVTVPYTRLSPQALRGVIEAFVLREGTEYGSHEFTLEDKVAQVTQQLERGEAEIFYDTVDETCDVRLKRKKKLTLDKEQ